MKKHFKTFAVLFLIALLCIGGYHGYCSIRSQKQFEKLAAALAYVPHDIYINYSYTDMEESDDHAHVNRFVNFTLDTPEQVSQVDALLAQLTYEGYFPEWQFKKRITPGEDSYFITVLKPGGTVENEDDILFSMFMTKSVTTFGGDTYFFHGELGNTEALYQAVREMSLVEKEQRADEDLAHRIS